MNETVCLFVCLENKLERMKSDSTNFQRGNVLVKTKTKKTHF